MPARKAMSLLSRPRRPGPRNAGPVIEGVVSLFRRAVAISPGYAKAYEGLAASQLYTHRSRRRSVRRIILARAREAAVQAIGWTIGFRVRHARLSWQRLLYNDWNFAAAEHRTRTRGHTEARPDGDRALVFAGGTAARPQLGRQTRTGIRGNCQLRRRGDSDRAGNATLECGDSPADGGWRAPPWPLPRCFVRRSCLQACFASRRAIENAAAEFSSCRRRDDGRVCRAAPAHLQARRDRAAKRISRLPSRTTASPRLSMLASATTAQAMRSLKNRCRWERELPLVSLDPRFRPLRRRGTLSAADTADRFLKSGLPQSATSPR